MSYRVLVLDADGRELSTNEEQTLRAAKALARDRIREREYLDAGAVKVEVRDKRDRCLYDLFAPTVQVMSTTKRWSYRQITDHAEQQIRRSMDLRAEGDRDIRRIHRLFAIGAYQYWNSLTMGRQEPGDDHRMAVLAEACCVCDICRRQRAADSVKPLPPRALGCDGGPVMSTLIAAAPLMLATLKTLAKECERCGGTGLYSRKTFPGGIEVDNDDQDCPDCVDARVAIDIAEGRAS